MSAYSLSQFGPRLPPAPMVHRAREGADEQKPTAAASAEHISPAALHLVASAVATEKVVGEVKEKQKILKKLGEGLFVSERAPIPTRNGSAVYRTVRTLFDTALFSSTTGDVQYTRTLTLANLPGYSSFKALFQSYRLTFGEVWFMPHANVTSAGQRSGVFASVTVHTVTNPLSSLSSALRYATCVVGEGRQGQYRTFVPYANLEVLAPSTAVGPVPSPWLSTDDDAVPHWGLLAIWTSTSPQCGYDIVVRITAEFANPR